jgi:thioredoxin-related protein
MRKAYLLLLLIPFGSFIYFMDFSNPWLTDFETASKEAKESGKPILLYFSGSDWCGNCIKLKKEVLENGDFKDYASGHLILMQADFPRMKKNQPGEAIKKQNELLAEKYNSGGVFPRLILLNPEGKIIKTWDGYNTKPDVFINQLKGCGQSPDKTL